MPVPNVQWMTPEDGQRNCPKHVEFCTRINLEINASVGFYCKEFFYDARSYERKNTSKLLFCSNESIEVWMPMSFRVAAHD